MRYKLTMNVNLTDSTSDSSKGAKEFGAFVRDLRLKNGITARGAAEACGMLPSNFSKLEHGALLPWHDPVKQKSLAAAIGIQEGSAKSDEFFDLAARATKSVPADLADIISRNEALPLLLRTIGNKRLSSDEVERLVAIVRGTNAPSKAV